MTLRRHRPRPRLIEGAHGRGTDPTGQRLGLYELGVDEPLAPSHLDVLERIAAGQLTCDIAAARGTTEHTVRRQVEQLRWRLHARNRAHAVAIGFRRGLLH